jgi:CrcB protein
MGYKEIIAVFTGGGLGSITRFGLSRLVNSGFPGAFPAGTFTVNIVACIVLGFAAGLADQRNIIGVTGRSFWVIGFCGGFSTFSAFSNETLQLAQGGNNFMMAAYVMLSVLCCIMAVIGGQWLAQIAVK